MKVLHTLVFHPLFLILLFGAIASAMLPGCGGSVDTARAVASPFSVEDETLFDSGVEFLEDPSHLSGRWREAWERELSGRVERADLIFVGGVESSREGQDGKGRPFLDLTAEVDRTLKGKQGRSLALRARERDPGFSGLVRAGDRLYSSPFVVFVKWNDEGDGSVRARFHLAYASAFVINAVREEVDSK